MRKTTKTSIKTRIFGVIVFGAVGLSVNLDAKPSPYNEQTREELRIIYAQKDLFAAALKYSELDARGYCESQHAVGADWNNCIAGVQSQILMQKMRHIKNTSLEYTYTQSQHSQSQGK